MSHAYGWEKKLRKTDEFSSVFRFRCSYRGERLVVLAAPNGLEHPRLGLIVPKKIIPTAVGRNRIKRLLREGFRLHQEHIAGLDVIARLQSAGDEPQLRQDFLRGLEACKACVDRRQRPENTTG
ncbi:MAG: ribonuclease P protein component [Betaproteobacteria bacterium]|nr:ribonuclease P protein component [Betaproteobacteria bacterium]